MAAQKITLKDGFKVGEKTYLEVSLRSLTAGDVMDANLDAERLEMVPQLNAAGAITGYGPEYVKSPTLVAMHSLRRQVSIVGLLEAPLEIEMLRKLSPDDINLLSRIANAMDAADLEAINRGRSDGAGTEN